jgi:hypothetical protein
MKTVKIILVSLFAVGLAACSSQPVTPQKNSVKTGRAEPDKSCRSLGSVKGITKKIKGTAADALEDLQQETANKGGNYVRVFEYSGTQTAVTGEAFQCP